MPNWRAKLKIKDVLGNEDGRIVSQKGEIVAQRLRVAAGKFSVLEFEIEELADDFASVDTVEEFDDCLDDLYNAADAARVWIE